MDGKIKIRADTTGTVTAIPELIPENSRTTADNAIKNRIIWRANSAIFFIT